MGDPGGPNVAMPAMAPGNFLEYELDLFALGRQSGHCVLQVREVKLKSLKLN